MVYYFYRHPYWVVPYSTFFYNPTRFGSFYPFAWFLIVIFGWSLCISLPLFKFFINRIKYLYQHGLGRIPGFLHHQVLEPDPVCHDSWNIKAFPGSSWYDDQLLLKLPGFRVYFVISTSFRQRYGILRSIETDRLFARNDVICCVLIRIT